MNRLMRALVMALATSATGVGCGASRSDTERRPTRPSSTDASTDRRTPPEVGSRFERHPIDMGLEGVTQLTLTVTETCALANDRLVCIARHGRDVRELAKDVALLSGSDSDGGDRICAFMKTGHLACFGGDVPYDFSWADQDLATSAQTPKYLSAYRDRITLVGDDGSVKTVQLLLGTDDHTKEVRKAFHLQTSSASSVTAIVIAHMVWGRVQCMLANGAESCVGANVRGTRDEIPMPAPVASIGGHCALLADQRVACFPATPTSPGEPRVLAKLQTARSIASDDGMGACAVLRDGRVSCFGDLGLVFTTHEIGPFEKPTIVDSLADVEQLEMADGRACARTKAGRVWCFGLL